MFFKIVLVSISILITECYYTQCNTQTCTQAELGHCALQIFHDEEWWISLQTLLMKHLLHPGGFGLAVRPND